MAKKVIAANELVQHQQAQLTDRDATVQRLTHLLDQQKHQHASQASIPRGRLLSILHVTCLCFSCTGCCSSCLTVVTPLLCCSPDKSSQVFTHRWQR